MITSQQRDDLQFIVNVFASSERQLKASAELLDDAATWTKEQRDAAQEMLLALASGTAIAAGILGDLLKALPDPLRN